MIPRSVTHELLALLKEYPVVTLLGPRQAGKTTLAQTVLPEYAYCNLESPEIRHFAESDPNAFLAQFQGKAILDEIQRVPELLSYIQVIVDERRQSGQFVITGSHQLALREAVSQSLAGRTGLLNLYPFSIRELASADIRFETAWQYIYQGFLPRVYDQNQRVTPAYSNYYRTYVERDVRQLINLKDSALFESFMKLLAGRVGQLMDYSSLAGDVGVSPVTIKHWLGILEASFIVFKLTPYFENFGKRVVKSPKYYFTDTGLLTFLLGIDRPEQVSRDPLIGQLFENLVVMECLKERCNRGLLPGMYFFRDSNGNEVDILLQRGRELVALEVKASSTYHPSLMKGLKRLQSLTSAVTRCCLVYAGESMRFSDGMRAIRYDQIAELNE